MKILPLILTLAFTFGAFGWEDAVEEIPNGNKFECNNCHYPSGKNEILTPFGKQVKSIAMLGNKVDWSKLYDKDADNDGFTNGEEMGDPNGRWKIGDADPIVSYRITKPWDHDDYPAPYNSEIYFTTLNAYPNPFYDKLTVDMCLEFGGRLLIEIFGPNGNLVAIIFNNYQLPGPATFVWDGKNDLGEQAPPGMYCLSITNDRALTSLNVIME